MRASEISQVEKLDMVDFFHNRTRSTRSEHGGQPCPALLLVPLAVLEKCPQGRQDGLKGHHEVPTNLPAKV